MHDKEMYDSTLYILLSINISQLVYLRVVQNYASHTKIFKQKKAIYFIYSALYTQVWECCMHASFEKNKFAYKTLDFYLIPENALCKKD